MASASKRIPVSEETWKELGKEKEPGQTWDELLEEIYIRSRKNRLSEKARKAKEGDLDTVDLDEL